MAELLTNIVKGVSRAGTNSSGKLWLVAKTVLLVLLSSILYNQVLAYEAQIGELHTILAGQYAILGLLVVALMMLANWILECAKWRHLLKHIVKVDASQAMKSILSGVSVALVTPGRVGEYGGRLLGIPANGRTKALLANGVGSIAQNICNIGIGIIGVVGYSALYLNMNQSSVVASIGIAGLVLSVMIFVYYNLQVVVTALTAMGDGKWLRKLTDHASFVQSYSSRDLSYVLLLSLCRYMVYACQYVILIILCGVTTDPLAAFLGVAVVFFVQSGIPLPPMLSVLARGEMAIWIWSVFSTKVVSILAATFLLWSINLVIPALIGAIVIWLADLRPST